MALGNHLAQPLMVPMGKLRLREWRVHPKVAHCRLSAELTATLNCVAAVDASRAQVLQLM